MVTVGLLGLGAAAIAFGGGGASSPEDAVQQLADAIDNEDVLAAVATFAPDETRSFPELYRQSVDKAKSLSGSGSGSGADDSSDSDDASNDFGELDLSVENLETTTTKLSDDVARVELTGGTVSWDLIEGEAAQEAVEEAFGSLGLPGPLDEFEDDLDGSVYEGSDDFDDFDESTDETTDEAADAGDDSLTGGSVDIAELRKEATDDDGPGLFAMATKRDGGWYVSPFFTIAEYARLASGGPELDTYDADSGDAADSPTAAVEDLAAGISSLNTKRIVDALASELDVLRLYSDSLDDSLAGDDIVSLGITGLELTEQPIDDDRVRVVIDKATINAVVNEVEVDEYDSDYDDDYDSEDDDYDESSDDDVDLPTVEVAYEMTIDGDCLTTTSDDESTADETVCLGDAGGGLATAFGVDRLALVAVADRGGWAISPIETVADYLRTVVEHLDQPLIDRISAMIPFVDSDREPTSELEFGPNQVDLDGVGVAVASLEIPEGTFATVTAGEDVQLTTRAIDADEDPNDDADTDDEAEEAFDGFFGAESAGLLRPGSYSVVVVAEIGAASAEVTVETIDIESLPVPAPDGTTPAPITGTLDDGDTVAFQVPASTYRMMSVLTGDLVRVSTTTSDGSSMYEEFDDDEVITIVLGTWSDDGFFDPVGEGEATGLGDHDYVLSFLPPSGGFAGPDPTTTTVDVDGFDWVPLTVVAGAPVDVTIESDVDLVVELSCPSSYESFDEDQPEPPSIPSTGGLPATMRITPVDDEVCDIDLTTGDDVPLSLGDVPVTLRVAPATP